MIDLINSDCLELDLPRVDLVLVDPPYGKTANTWDSILPFDRFWGLAKTYCIFGVEPFASKLRQSSNLFKYDWVWLKNRPTNFLNAKHQPLRAHETISVFYDKAEYYPQKTTGHNPTNNIVEGRDSGSCYGKTSLRSYGGKVTDRYPVSYLEFDCERGLHPTQKPVALLEYLIKTYTNEGDTVLDFCMGSGSTGVACQNTGRNFIGIEKEKKYYDIACERMAFKG